MYKHSFCVTAYRGKAYVSQLLGYVLQLTKELHSEAVTLDSGCHRYDVGRLYMNKGFVIQGYHFSKRL